MEKRSKVMNRDVMFLGLMTSVFSLITMINSLEFGFGLLFWGIVMMCGSFLFK